MAIVCLSSVPGRGILRGFQHSLCEKQSVIVMQQDFFRLIFGCTFLAISASRNFFGGQKFGG